jgi:enoyl-CoA hydratase
VVEADELIKKTREILDKIRQRAPLAIAGAIRAVNSSLSSDVNGFDVEIEEFGKCFNTSDFKEGVAAFLEKRKPSFLGK